MMVVAGVVGGSSLNEICLTFIESTKSVVSSILVIGFTRGILIVMKEALISDTIVYYLSSLLDIGNPVRPHSNEQFVGQNMSEKPSPKQYANTAVWRLTPTMSATGAIIGIVIVA